jgi:hypothetical protein
MTALGAFLLGVVAGLVMVMLVLASASQGRLGL